MSEGFKPFIKGLYDAAPKCKECGEMREYWDDELCIRCRKKRGERMNEVEGYCPHDGMGYFTCPNCGCGEWESYPQAMPVDRSKTWTYEYHCARCGKMMGLTLKGDE